MYSSGPRVTSSPGLTFSDTAASGSVRFFGMSAPVLFPPRPSAFSPASIILAEKERTMGGDDYCATARRRLSALLSQLHDVELQSAGASLSPIINNQL